MGKKKKTTKQGFQFSCVIVNSNCFMNKTEKTFVTTTLYAYFFPFSSSLLLPMSQGLFFSTPMQIPTSKFSQTHFQWSQGNAKFEVTWLYSQFLCWKVWFFFSFSLYSYCVKIWVLRLSVILHWAMPTAMTKGKQMELISCTSWKGVGFVWIPRPNFGF